MHTKIYYFYTVGLTKITGFKQEDNAVVEIWNFYVSSMERIVATASSFNGEDKAHIPLFENDKVIFKNVDFTNLAVLTSKNATNL
jgi:hypothetical protein